MRIGIVSPRWPPHGGGAEVYARRLAKALSDRGHRVEAAVGVPAAGAAADGAEGAAGGPAVHRSPAAVDPDDPAACRAWYRHLAPWLSAGRFDVVLVNAPLTRASHAHARELFDEARRTAGRVGALFFDLGRGVASELSWAYAMTGSWERAAARVLEQARDHLLASGEERGYLELESPLLFRPHFVLSCSEWSDRFIDPLGSVPRAVLHPLLGPPGGEGDGAPPEDLAPVTASFVNPLPHKGLDRFVEIVRKSPPEWTFRVLAGGYGQGLEQLREALSRGTEPQAGRVETVARVPDMGPFYRASGLLLVPSLYEGYGLVAVEPMRHGTPVVASAYPAILEGVGDAAATLPFTASASGWVERMEAVLSGRETWAERGRRRAAHLLDRQELELDALIRFLDSP